MRELLYKRVYILMHRFRRMQVICSLAYLPKKSFPVAIFHICLRRFTDTRLSPAILVEFAVTRSWRGLQQGGTASVKRKTRPKFQCPRMPRFFCG